MFLKVNNASALESGFRVPVFHNDSFSLQSPKCLKVLTYSGWNPPPGNRRMHGEFTQQIVLFAPLLFDFSLGNKLLKILRRKILADTVAAGKKKYNCRSSGISQSMTTTELYSLRARFSFVLNQKTVFRVASPSAIISPFVQPSTEHSCCFCGDAKLASLFRGSVVSVHCNT